MPSALAAALCRQIDGLPRHLGQPSGGIVITRAVGRTGANRAGADGGRMSCISAIRRVLQV